MKKRCLLTILLGGCVVMNSLAQITLSGRVINAETGKPVSGASVRLEQTTMGCATNSKGEFLLKDVKEGKYVLRASCLNYTAVTQKVAGSKTNMLIKLPSSYINLDQVVITGTGTHHKLKETPVPIEVISATDIKKAGVTDFQSAMTMLQPSLSFSSNAMGSYLMMNGLSNKYVLILINGKKLTGDTSNNIDLSRIDMNNIKRIEVLKGAGSALYGSDAIAGVINIITDNPKNLLTVTSDTRFEEYGQFTQGVSADVTTKKFGSYTSYRHQQAHGWQQNSLDEDGEPTAKSNTSAFNANIVNQKFTFDPTTKLSLYTEAGYYNRLTDRPVAGYDYNLAYDSYNLGVGAKYLLGNSSYLNFDVANDNYETDYKYLVESGNYEPGDKNMIKRQHYYNVNLKGVFKHSDYFKSVLGLEYVNEALNRPDASVDKNVYTGAFYAQEEINLLKDLQAIVGIRYIHHETAGNNFAPKASLMYKLSHFNFRASYSGGFRAPGLDELYYYMLKSTTLTAGSSDLKAEKSNYGSLNAEYVSNCFTASVTAYINSIDDMINGESLLLSAMSDEERQAIINEATAAFGKQATDKMKTYKQYRNLDRALVKGVDANLSAYLGYGFTLGGGYSFAYARGKDQEGNWANIERSIRHTASVIGNWVHTWNNYQLNLNLNGRMQSKRFQQSSGVDESAPGFGLWNLNTRHTFDCGKSFIVEPGFGVNNIFDYKDDRPYGVNYATLTPGRTVYVSLLLKFKQ
ncbi:TonB-dependent receptor [uncultured Bacteroides sp.]|uniref:TonB-dependent receptor n=1 Tax=uncultured Bacteroides sp. TaxID=162156 RepID=UPI002AA78648|nr:TonB-dependent receptor [uncultured Bacteroides sp.]